ncbi:MAG TPA: FHA domain-containing protein [Acidimicrobiales bacterium]
MRRGWFDPLVGAQNYTAILRPMQWLVLALVFLFFLRVIRAVWVEVRPAGARLSRAERRRQDDAAEPARAPSRRRLLSLRVVEPEEHHGRSFDLDDELTIGRSPGCGVPTTYDAFSSTLHARLFRRGDQLWVEDLGSTNGTFVNSERIARAIRLAKGDLLQVGATVFEVTR